MTLNGRTALYCTSDAFFRAHRGNLKEDKPIQSAQDFAFGSCGYLSGFRAEGASTTVGQYEPAIFSNFGRHIFRTFKDEANIITRGHEVPYPLSSDRKMLDFERP